MDTLTTLLDSNDLSSLTEMTNEFFVTAEGYENKLKIEIISKVEHNRWVAENLLGGYRPPTSVERDLIVRD